MPWSFSAPSMLAILGAYFVAMLALTTVLAPRADAEGFIVADRDVGFGWGAASMSATWIWAASMYAAATAAFTYGISGAFHYAFWGGLGLLFIWKYGQRVRRMVPHGHTFPEFVKTRHGRLSHGVVGIENYVNSQYSLIINFTAGAAIISLFSPLSYEASLVVTAVIVVGYSILSGIRASVVTDLVQVAAMVLVAAVAVPLVFFHAGGPGAFAAALPRLGEQGQLLSLQAFLGQGAPMMALILAYAFANPTVWQRIWVVRDRQLRGTFVTSGLMYMALTFSVGTFGFVALVGGLQPVDGDLNTIVPLVAATYLPAAMAVPFLLLVLAAIASTSDSDLAALSSMAMTDLWRGYVRPDAGDAELKLVARLAMVGVAVAAVAVAMLRLDILTLILVYGMVRAASVFPIAASIVWDRVSNLGFSLGIVGGIALGLLSRLWSTPGADGASLLSRTPAAGLAFVLVSSLGAGVMVGCLAWPFARSRGAGWLGVATMVAVLAVQLAGWPGLLTYNSILSTLTSLGVGMVVCLVTSLLAGTRFDWAELDRRIRPFPSAREAT